MKDTTILIFGNMTCEKSNDNEKATLTVYPNKRTLFRENNDLTSFGSEITDETYETIKPFLCEDPRELDGKSLSGVSQFKNSDKNSDKKSYNVNFVPKVIMATQKKTYFCNLDRINRTTVDGKKAFLIQISTIDMLGKGATARKAISFHDLSKRERDVTMTVHSNIPSFNNVLKLNLSNFNTLSKAIIAADFENDLAVQGMFSGQTNYTILPPTNKAFDKLPSGTVENLLKPENKLKLRGILQDHVFKGKLSVADIKKKKCLTAVSGKHFDVNVKQDGSVTVGTAKIVTPDVKIVNGWAHVINSVLQ